MPMASGTVLTRTSHPPILSSPIYRVSIPPKSMIAVWIVSVKATAANPPTIVIAAQMIPIIITTTMIFHPRRLFSTSAPANSVKRHFCHDAYHQHQPGKERSRRRVVSHFEKFRDGEYLVLEIEGKKECAGESEGYRGGKFYRSRAEAIPVGISGKPDQMLRSDIRGKERRPDNRPGQFSSGEKKVGAAFPGMDSHREYEAENETPAQSQNENNPVDACQSECHLFFP